MKFRYLTSVALICLTATGCASTSSVKPGEAVIDAPSEAPLRADINPGYQVGQMDIETGKAKSLNDILAKNVHKPKEDRKETEEDKLRRPAMQEVALSFGSRAGLAYETDLINKRIQANSDKLTTIYNFKALMIQGPNNSMIKPPVISEAVDAWETFDAGKSLRVADTVYEIMEQASFVPSPPIWQEYLITTFSEADAPPDALLPQNESEREAWNKWIKEGWKNGQEQAHEIFKANLDRLNRDFVGMVRYSKLLEEKKVSPPSVTANELGATGTGSDMRVKDVTVKMVKEPTLQVQSTQSWDASPTTTDAKGQVKGPDKVIPKQVERPKPNYTPKKKKSSSHNQASKQKTSNVEKIVKKTTSGNDRF